MNWARAVTTAVAAGFLLVAPSTSYAAAAPERDIGINALVCNPTHWVEVPGNGTVIVYPAAVCTGANVLVLEITTWFVRDGALMDFETITYNNRPPGTYPNYGVQAGNPLGTQQFCATTRVEYGTPGALAIRWGEACWRL